MKNKNTLIAAIFAVQLATYQAQYTSPTDGKYFYGGLDYGEGQTFVKIQVGSNKQEMNFLFNSEELTLAMFSETCRHRNQNITGLYKCNVPSPYNDVLDADAVRNGGGQQDYETAYLYDPPGIKGLLLTGWETTTTFNITAPQYLRQMSFTGHAFEVFLVSEDYDSNVASGYIGFGPYSAIDKLDGSNARVQVEENFLYQLKADGLIDHQVIAFYMDTDNSREAFVKFGNYDPEAFVNKDSITLLNTIDDNSWTLNSKSVGFFSDSNRLITEGFTTIIEPSFPWFYTSQFIFDNISQWLRSNKVLTNVDFFPNAIVMSTPCDQVTIPNTRYMNIIYGNNDTEEFRFDLQDLLVSSEDIASNVIGKCYLGIFPTTNAKAPKTIYLGQLYLKKYYTFFDASGYQEGNHTHLVVGTGLKNVNANILESHYNRSFPTYKNQEGDQSTWTYEPNPFQDAPTPTPGPSPPIDPSQPDQPGTNDNGDDTPKPNKDDDSEGKSGSNIIVFVVIIAVVVVLILAVLAFLYVRKQKQKGLRASAKTTTTNTKIQDDEFDSRNGSTSIDNSKLMGNHGVVDSSTNF